jgi:formate dehydrogenase beta subunit
MSADMVIAATGQKSDLALFAGKDPVATTGWGSIKTDPVTYKTNVEGIFAGGDCVSGPATLIEALNAGNKVAQSIDCALRGKAYADANAFSGIDTAEQRDSGYVREQGAKKTRFLDADRRLQGMAEVEGGFSAGEAMAEAGRCLRCYRLMVWE